MTLVGKVLLLQNTFVFEISMNLPFMGEPFLYALNISVLEMFFFKKVISKKTINCEKI